MFNMKFKDYLVEKRIEKKMLKKDVASFFGWTSMYYGRFESGSLLPTKRNFNLFKEFLEISDMKLVEIIFLSKKGSKK